MASDVELVLLFTALHLVGLLVVAMLFVMVFRSDTARGWQPPEEDEGPGGGGGSDRLRPRSPDRPRGGLPLPDASPARVRLRDHTPLADLIPGPSRRPAREPARVPRTPVRGRSAR